MGCTGSDTGSTTVVAVRPKYDCTNKYSTWESSWSNKKKQWCCENMNMGCIGSIIGTTTRISIRPKYDCTNKYSTWESSWSNKKKRWCCENMKMGCTSSDTGTTSTVAIADTTATTHTGPTIIGTSATTSTATMM